ncbi:hypothetical protein [Streptomyces sp. NPDC058653]|uniref:hypothetical protein n=1 Tax=Streptomyces sp. NPDC058653 TaxID=3346576 RepID=UPI00365DE5E6
MITDTSTRDQLLARRSAELERRHVVVEAIRSQLAEQPSASTVRASARDWCRDITALAESVIAAKNSTETHE